MNDLDQLLRDAGARLRDTAPSAEATETALAGLDDVRLDDVPNTRRRLWVIAPAILAAAAVTLGVLVLTRPADEAIRPAETVPTTVAPAPTTVPAPAPGPAPSTVPATVASTVAPTTPASTTPTTTADEVELFANTRLRSTDVDFDGDGGACLTVVKTSGEEVARGCATGPTMRSTYGQGLRFRVDEVPVVLFPTGRDGSGQPELVLMTSSTPCVDALGQPTRMVEEAGCTDAGAGVVGILPTSSAATTSWQLVSSSPAPAVELLTTAEAVGVRVFRAAAQEDVPACLIVTARGRVAGEACGVDAGQPILAGTGDAPLLVTDDARAGTTELAVLDPVASLAASGCTDLTVADMLRLLPATGTVERLLCGADTGVAHRPASRWLAAPTDPVVTDDVLAREAGGSWSVVDSRIEPTCADLPAVCEALDVADLTGVPPVPSAATIAAFDEALGGASTLPGRDAIDIVGDLPTARTVAQMADALVVLLREVSDPEQRIEVVGEGTPIVIHVVNLDDSVTATILVIATATRPDDPGVIAVTHIRAFDVCGRGLSTLDGQPVCL